MMNERAEFENGYLSTQYLLGLRGKSLGDGSPPRSLAGVRLQLALRHEHRAVRAQALAAALARLVAVLEAH